MPSSDSPDLPGPELDIIDGLNGVGHVLDVRRWVLAIDDNQPFVTDGYEGFGLRMDFFECQLSPFLGGVLSPETAVEAGIDTEPDLDKLHAQFREAMAGRGQIETSIALDILQNLIHRMKEELGL